MLGLRIKPSKTKAMYFHLPAAPALSVNGENIEVVDSFTYLGSVISGNRICAADDIDSRISKASRTFGALKRHVFGRNDISVSLKIKVFNASVLSVLLYAAETWAPRKPDLIRLEVFQMSCLRCILKVSRLQRLRNTEIRSRCDNQPSIECAIQKRRLRWLGHVARMDQGRICSSTWRNPKPNTWRCTRNAGKCTWDSLVAKDLAHLKGVYGAVNWSNHFTDIITDLAADRVQWRRVILGQATADVLHQALRP